MVKAIGCNPINRGSNPLYRSMKKHLIYDIDSVTGTAECSCGLKFFTHEYYGTLQEWFDHGAADVWKDHQEACLETPTKWYIIHPTDLNAWGPVDSFELAEQILQEDKWFESWCYVGDQYNLDNHKEIDLYSLSDYSDKFTKYDVSSGGVLL